MRIAAGQIESRLGDFDYHLEQHLHLMSLAAEQGANLIIYPELSLTGYLDKGAIEMAKEFAPLIMQFTQVLQQASNQFQIAIGGGFPKLDGKQVFINHRFIFPDCACWDYQKRLLHDDELPYYTPGQKDNLLQWQNKHLAIGICYESLQQPHVNRHKNADAYLVGVAKSNHSMASAFEFYGETARKLNMPIIFSNATGKSADYINAGQSAVWTNSGALKAVLNKTETGLVCIDI
ncbi:carbon-nitrogen hydrolase family protein [Glaciecola sp. 1036]|uniref:carbon-nitrogen hydrolase family protein n=1 Tax=Alteromonadaceae TaxID=72275 RepID=UPI003CFF4F12